MQTQDSRCQRRLGAQNTPSHRLYRFLNALSWNGLLEDGVLILAENYLRRIAAGCSDIDETVAWNHAVERKT